ncbi:MAG: L-fucose isomerase [Ruminococcaceae bacterium]|nr:L-fucose isomerase [Oscillospiraceae bacterium]
MLSKIGIRPVIDGRQFGIRESLEEQTMNMAKAAAELITSKVRHASGEPVECVIADTTIGGIAESAACEEKFSKENVVATLTVTPCWCYVTTVIDENPNTIKAIWGFNGTERPGAVFLAAAMSAYAQIGMPCFSIYGHDVKDADDKVIPDDVEDKMLRFARCAVAVGDIRNKSYVNIGAVAMGIAGSYCNEDFFRSYLGMHPEWVDMTEIIRREKLGIYDKDEYEKALAWIKANCKEGIDINPTDGMFYQRTVLSPEEKEENWQFIAKMTCIVMDIMKGNPKLAKMGWLEESKGRNAILGGFQGQRNWTDFMPNADFTEAILNTSFDWNGKREPIPFATENDGLNGVTLLLLHEVTSRAAVFADVRTYWSPEAVERVTGWKPEGVAENGFIHLINSGAAALDGTGACLNENGENCMKNWWDMTDKDIDACLKATTWPCANLGYFRGGGFSSSYSTKGVMPCTFARVNLVKGLGPAIQIVEGYTVELPENVNKILLERTDKTWPSTWFTPILTGTDSFKDVYSVMANWGANHGAFVYGHVGADMITLASMLRIPVSLHNISEDRIYRPHAWTSFGTKDLEGADYRACANYGSLY